MSSLNTIIDERNRIEALLEQAAPGLMERYRKLRDAADLLIELEGQPRTASVAASENPPTSAVEPEQERRGRNPAKPDEFKPDSIYASILRVLNAFGENGGSAEQVANATGRRWNHVSRALKLLGQWGEVVEKNDRYWHPEFADEPGLPLNGGANPAKDSRPQAAVSDAAH